MFKQRLARDVAILMGIKFAALCAIYLAFFSGSARAPVDPAAHIAGLNAASNSSSTR